jgi:hypothetical protein
MGPTAFLDTTVVTDLVLKTGAAREAARIAVANRDVLVPQYALKELKLGPLQHYRWLYDKLRQERSLSRALDALHRLSRTRQRGKASTAMEALTLIASFFGQFTWSEVTPSDSGETVDVVMAELVRLEIKKRVLRAWKKRSTIGNRFDELACYPETEIVASEDRLELKPNQCDKTKSCAVQRLITMNLDQLDKVIEALAALPDKAENLNRRRVLKEIRKRPSSQITPEQCRAIGDAYFALRCPSTAELTTTNVKDIEPLATAIGKKTRRP